MFRIEYDAAEKRLRITVAGFWAPQDVPGFSATLIAQAREAQAFDPGFDVLIDSLEFPVQATDVADLMTEVMRGGMAVTTGRAAIVVGSELNRLQAERTLVHPRVRVFRTIKAARQWLDERPEASPE